MQLYETLSATASDLLASVAHLHGEVTHAEHVSLAKRYRRTVDDEFAAVVCDAQEILYHARPNNAGPQFRYRVVTPDGYPEQHRPMDSEGEAAFLGRLDCAPTDLGSTAFVVLPARPAVSTWRFRWDEARTVSRSDVEATVG